MPPKISSAFAALLFVACGGATAAPKVAVDIAPVHSLVAAVMGQTATPELLLRPGASPHGYAMAPSEARALAGADLVFWVGPALTPWLDRAIDTLAPTARTIAVMQVKDIQTLPFREGALFDDHDH
ncbi:MAG: metal ABC transporter solute-binding protein, Zn/Mn family, partial [Pikeienuella sp.]